MDNPADNNPFAQVPIEVTISVGKARPLVRDLLRLSRDAVLALDRRVDDPVELYVGDRLTTVPSREIDPKTARKIRKQLGLAD